MTETKFSPKQLKKLLEKVIDMSIYDDMSIPTLKEHLQVNAVAEEYDACIYIRDLIEKKIKEKTC